MYQKPISDVPWSLSDSYQSKNSYHCSNCCLFSKYSEARWFGKFPHLFSKYSEARLFGKFPHLFSKYSEACWFGKFPHLFSKYSEA